MTTRTKKVLDALTSTMKINPNHYSALSNSPNRIQSLGYALAGWLYMLRHQKNTRIMSAAIALLCLALALGALAQHALPKPALSIASLAVVFAAYLLANRSARPAPRF